MNGAGRPTSDLIRSRPASRGTTGERVSSSAAEEEKKKKPDEPVPVPTPPTPGDPTGGTDGAGDGDSGGTERSSAAGLRVRDVVPATGAAGLESGVAKGEKLCAEVGRPTTGAVSAVPVL